MRKLLMIFSCLAFLFGCSDTPEEVVASYEKGNKWRAYRYIEKGGDIPNLVEAFNIKVLQNHAELPEHQKLINLLIDKTSDVNIKDQLLAAQIASIICRKDTNELKRMLPRLSDINKDYGFRSPLHFAVLSNNIEAATIILDTTDADVNQLSGGKVTLLHIAGLKGYADMIALLLKYGADKKIKDFEGKTPEEMLKAYLKEIDHGTLYANDKELQKRMRKEWNEILLILQKSK